MLKMPAFDPAEVKESNATSYPPPYHTDNTNRYNRRTPPGAAALQVRVGR